MGKVYNDRLCSNCGLTCTVIESWGVNYCKPCYETRHINEDQITLSGFEHPKRVFTGHGGMIANDSKTEDYVNHDVGITLERCQKSHPIFCNLFLEHYPGSKGIMGRNINYIVRDCGTVAGIIGGNSPPLNYKLFREYFNTEDESTFLNNNVYRIVNSRPNLGTKVLSAFRKTVTVDYFNDTGIILNGFITFVEPPRTGAMYKADNWDYLGLTQGKSVRKRGMKSWQNKDWSEGTKKHIYGIKQKNRLCDVEKYLSSGEELPQMTLDLK